MATLILAPPFGQDVDFASRGLKMDQLLLLPWLYAVLLLRPREVGAALLQPIALAFGAFAFASIISSLIAIASVSDVNASAALANCWGAMRWLVLYLCASATFARMTTQDRSRSLAVIVSIGLVTIIVATMQLSGEGAVYEITTKYYRRKVEFEAVLDSIMGGRVYGTFDGQANAFGTFAAICVLCATSRLTASETRAGTLVWFALVTVFAWGLAISWSRGAYAGALAGVLVLLSLRRRRSVRVIFSAVIAAALLYALLPDGVRDRFTQLLHGTGFSSGESIFDARVPYWRANWELFLKHPFFGVRGVPMAPLDSLYLGLLVVNGLVGACLFVVFVIIAILALWREWRTAARPEALAALCVTVALCVNGISTPTFFAERVQEVVVVLIALALARTSLAHGRGISGVRVENGIVAKVA